MTGAPEDRRSLGRLGLAFFYFVMIPGLAFQAFIEMVCKGLGSSIAPASTAAVSVPLAAVPTMALLFVAFINRGPRLAVRALGYAASLHGLLCGWLWITLSTPMREMYPDYAFNWLDNHPDLAGLWLMLASGAVWLALFATSPALPPELKRLRGFP